MDTLAISSSAEYLVVIGSMFHYVFQAPPSLVGALRSELKPVLAAEFSTFQLDSATDIRGTAACRSASVD